MFSVLVFNFAKKMLFVTPYIHSSILGEFHGQKRLVGYSPWGHKELDMTE